MPLYEYKCTACQRHTEKIQKFSDPEITSCPHCGGLLQRVISAPAFALKGGGWYADGYSSAKPGSSVTGDSMPSATAPASTSTPASAPAPAASPATATASVGAKT
jgi:putative FmdB family regulatory protein